MNQGRKNDLFPVLLLLAAFLLLNSISYKNGHDWGDDFSQYIYQAKSLVDGTTGRLLEVSKYRYENSETKIIGPILYPWGYPILLSPVYSLFGLDLLPMKAFTNLFFLFSLAAVFLLFKDRLSRFHNYLILIIMGLNPYFFSFKDNIVSDIPFMFFSLLSIFFMQRFIMEKKPFLNETAGNVLIGASIFISCAIRGNGIILVPTLFTVQLIESIPAIRSRAILSLRTLSALIPYGVFALLTIMLGALLPSESSGSYSDQMNMVSIETIAKNIVYYALLPAEFFVVDIYPPFRIIAIVLFLLSAPLVLLGVVMNFRENYHFIAFSALTVLLYILWPGTQGLRFIFPVIPFYLFFAFAGLSRLGLTLPIPVMKRYAAIHLPGVFSFMVIFVFGLTLSAQMYIILSSSGQDVLNGPYTKDSIELFRYISNHTQGSDIIIFFKPRAMTLYTGRKSIKLTKIEGILASQARYIACEKNEVVDLEFQNCKAAVSKVFENKTFTLYRKQHPSAKRKGVVQIKK